VVEIWATVSTVELYVDGERVASHERSYAAKGTCVTDDGHLSHSAREAKRWPQERMLGWAASHGPHVERAAERLLGSYPRPEFGYRALLGIIRLADQYGSVRLDEACAEALRLSAVAPRRRLLQALLQKRGPRRDGARSLGSHEYLRSPADFDFEGTSALRTAKEEMH
jgi:hypothetical protein